MGNASELLAVGAASLPTHAQSPEAGCIQLVVAEEEVAVVSDGEDAVGGIFGIGGLIGEPDGTVWLAGLGGTVKAGLTGAEFPVVDVLLSVLHPQRASRASNGIMRFMVVGGVEVSLNSISPEFFAWQASPSDIYGRFTSSCA